MHGLNKYVNKEGPQSTKQAEQGGPSLEGAAKTSGELILCSQFSPGLSFSSGYARPACTLHVTPDLGIFWGQAAPVLSSGHACGHSLPSSVPPSLDDPSGLTSRLFSVAPALGHSRHGYCHTLLRRFKKKKETQVCLHLRGTIQEKIFISENIKEVGLLCQDFYFKTARLILYTCLHLGITFSNLIWKEMIFREGEKKQTSASEIGTGMKLYFILTPLLLQLTDFQLENSVHILVRILSVASDRKPNSNWQK